MDWLKKILWDNPVMAMFRGKKTHIIGWTMTFQGLVGLLGAPEFVAGDWMTWFTGEDVSRILDGLGLSAVRAGISKYVPMLELLLSKIRK